MRTNEQRLRANKLSRERYALRKEQNIHFLEERRAFAKQVRMNNPFKACVASIRRKCKKLDLPFDLTPEFLSSLKMDICPITRRKILPLWEKGGDNSRYGDKPSLDRVVPTLGYVKGNVQWLSVEGNRLKSDNTLETLQRLTDYIKEHNKGSPINILHK